MCQLSCCDMSQEVKDRQCVKALEKFQQTVKQLLRETVVRRSVNGVTSGDDRAQVTQVGYLVLSFMP